MTGGWGDPVEPDPPKSGEFPSATPRKASSEHQQRVVEWFADRMRIDREERSAEVRDCLAVKCPHCGAPENRPCWQTAGHRALKDRPPIEVAHLHRRKAYRATTEE